MFNTDFGILKSVILLNEVYYLITTLVTYVLKFLNIFHLFSIETNEIK